MQFEQALSDFTTMLSECRLGSQFALVTAMQSRRAGVEGSLHILLPYRGRDLADVDFQSRIWYRPLP